MEEWRLEINENEWLTDAFKRENKKELKYPLNAIPTNCIFDKTLPGLGATYSEIKAKRSSIIIEPNVPVIVGKKADNPNILAVYEKTKDGEIASFLTNNRIHKKIVCTPESYLRVQRIAIESEIDIQDFRDEYFCLFDECEKITQDSDYRKSISLPIKDFFLYPHKALVSATPLEMGNPGFAENGFFKLKIEPLFNYRKSLDLIFTNRYEKTVSEKLDELNENSECVCIFLNSTNGINKLVDYIERKKITDYNVFCSDKSVIKNKKRNIINTYSELQPLKKFNFFTSRFFSAVDINSQKKPDILILTDLNEAPYTRIDPFTNTIQIYGRFRNPYPDGKKFNSLTHITNINESETILTSDELKAYIQAAEKVYLALQGNSSPQNNRGKEKLIQDDLQKVTYNQFIYEDGDVNYFSIDNLYDDERVKNYYRLADNLVKAYQDTKHFDFDFDVIVEPIGDDVILRYRKTISGTKLRMFIVEALESLEKADLENTNIPEYIKSTFYELDDRKKNEVVDHIIKAYEKLGGEAIRGTAYQKNRIDALLKKNQNKTNEQKMFSPEVRDAVKQQIWSRKKMLKTEAKQVLESIFKAHGITATVFFTTLERYGGIRPLKGKNETGQIQFLKFQPDEEFE